MKDKMKDKMKDDYEPTLVEIISKMWRGVAKSKDKVAAPRQVAPATPARNKVAAPKPRQVAPATPARNISDLENYLVLQGKTHGSYSYPDLLVSNERTHLGKDWNDTQKELRKEDSFMLTIRQFVDYLTLLKSGTAYDGSGKQVGKSKLDAMLSDIVEVKDPWKVEWLDAKLGKYFGRNTITYHKIKTDGTLEEVTEPLADYLTASKRPGISLDYWLQDATSQGLPPGEFKIGNIWYSAPGDGTVAAFFAASDCAGLDCHRTPQYSDPTLGVRAVKRGKTK